MISFKSSLEDIVVLDPENPSWIAAASVVADTAAVNLNGIKMLLANDLSTFLSKDYPVFSNGPKILLKILPVCPNLCNWVFDNFILADKPL